jgi:patatin-like phospholipase/acyl hydrolase
MSIDVRLQIRPSAGRKISAPSERGIRLLALDGGGVRGLSSLQILDQLMTAINPASPPRPCDFFDLIGGTSTGGYVRLAELRL